MENYNSTVAERFMKYVQIDTTADPNSTSFPSSMIQKNLGKLLVEELKEMGISEKIFVQFVIDKAGKITKATVVRGEDKHLKGEALRLVNSIPKLQAAKQRGKAVPCSFTVPINFKLQ